MLQALFGKKKTPAGAAHERRRRRRRRSSEGRVATVACVDLHMHALPLPSTSCLSLLLPLPFPHNITHAPNHLVSRWDALKNNRDPAGEQAHA